MPLSCSEERKKYCCFILFLLSVLMEMFMLLLFDYLILRLVVASTTKTVRWHSVWTVQRVSDMC